MIENEPQRVIQFSNERKKWSGRLFLTIKKERSLR
jgi:hypothetical protein